MNAQDRGNRFIEQWKVNIYPDPLIWNLQRDGYFHPNRDSLHQAVIAICKGALRIIIPGDYKRHSDDNDPTHTPSGRAKATLNWEGWTRQGNWEIISIETEKGGKKYE